MGNKIFQLNNCLSQIFKSIQIYRQSCADGSLSIVYGAAALQTNRMKNDEAEEVSYDNICGMEALFKTISAARLQTLPDL